MNIPCLFITYDRLQYTKEALRHLLNSDVSKIFIWDNGSTDGTKEYLVRLSHPKILYLHLNPKNEGIRIPMNWFIQLTPEYEYVAKVDNDTVIPPDFCARMIKHMSQVDMVQAKHHIIEDTISGGWDNFIKLFKKAGDLYLSHFIGGSGILVKRKVLSDLPHTDWLLYSWRTWQAQNPKITKAFASDVEIVLLDEHGYTDYPDYYKKTGRLKTPAPVKP